VRTARDTRDFLRLLTELVPTPDGVNHALVVNGGKLTVCLFHGGAWESYYIEDEDLDKDVDTLVSEVMQLRKQRKA
jgi:hypothetical protein